VPVIPCEDYSGSFQDDTVAIVAVADGHGDPNCFRSRYGSQFAVESAMENLTEFCSNMVLEDLFDEKEQKKVFQQLIDSILGKWYMKIEDQLSAMPFTEEEMRSVSDKYKERFNRGERLETAYGSTLLCVALTANYCFGLQIGDGSIVMVSYQNAEMSQPMPPDEECFSNITTSICDKDASNKFRYFVSRNLPLAFFVGSDGIDDSFDGVDELLSKYRGILSLFGEYGFGKSVEEIESYLPNLSKRGSGDDVSMAGIVDMATVNLYPELLKLQVRDFSLARKGTKLHEDGKNIASMHERFLMKLLEDLEETKKIEVELKEKQKLGDKEQDIISKFMAELTNSQKKKDKLLAEVLSLTQDLTKHQESNQKQKDRLEELKERRAEAKKELTEVITERKDVTSQLQALKQEIAVKTIDKGEYVLSGELPVSQKVEEDSSKVEVFVFDVSDIWSKELEIPDIGLDEITSVVDDTSEESAITEAEQTEQASWPEQSDRQIEAQPIAQDEQQPEFQTVQESPLQPVAEQAVEGIAQVEQAAQTDLSGLDVYVVNTNPEVQSQDYQDAQQIEPPSITVMQDEWVFEDITQLSEVSDSSAEPQVLPSDGEIDDFDQPGQAGEAQ
jgi:hypothetical protein